MSSPIMQPYTVGGGSGRTGGIARLFAAAKPMLDRKKADDPEYQLMQAARPGQGMDELSQSIRSLFASSLPGFQNAIQGVRANAIQRGISTGDLGTSYEGDLASAFQRNLLNEVGGRAYDLYQTRLDLLTGAADRRVARKNAKAQSKGSMLGGLFGGVGSLVGGLFG